MLAGVNGAGKSSLLGETVLAEGGVYYNPDAMARHLRDQNPALGAEAANSEAWRLGVEGLRRAVAGGQDYVFETTLGASTITGILLEAARDGHDVAMLFVGLEGPELHLARVRARVAAGGHDIPEARVRARYDSSRANLIRLLPYLSSLRLFDNSAEADLAAGQPPAPRELLRMGRGVIQLLARATELPVWARPVVMAAIQLDPSGAWRLFSSKRPR